MESRRVPYMGYQPYVIVPRPVTEMRLLKNTYTLAKTSRSLVMVHHSIGLLLFYRMIKEL
jgi:hypothetical protein